MSGLALALVLTAVTDPGPVPAPPKLFTNVLHVPRPPALFTTARPTPPPTYAYRPPPPPPPRRAGTVLSYWVDSLPGRSLDHAWGLTGRAAARWSSAADLDLVPALSRREATVIVHPRAMPWFSGYLGLTDVGHPPSLRSGRQGGLSLGITRDYRGDDSLMVSLLTHEFGHAIGLNHTDFGNTMGPAVHGRTPFTAHDAGYVASLYGPRR